MHILKKQKTCVLHFIRGCILAIQFHVEAIQIQEAVNSAVTARSLIFGLGTGRFSVREFIHFPQELYGRGQNLYQFLKLQPSFPLSVTFTFSPITQCLIQAGTFPLNMELRSVEVIQSFSAPWLTI